MGSVKSVEPPLPPTRGGLKTAPYPQNLGIFRFFEVVFSLGNQPISKGTPSTSTPLPSRFRRAKPPVKPLDLEVVLVWGKPPFPPESLDFSLPPTHPRPPPGVGPTYEKKRSW